MLSSLIIAGISAQSVNVPCCNSNQVCDTNCFQSGMNYCDEGCRDYSCMDNDCIEDVNRYTDNSKCTDITRNNQQVGPNIKRVVNECQRNLATCINKQHALNRHEAVPIAYPYRSYNHDCGGGG